MKPTIVIIEDDKAARHSLRMVLEAFGHQVEDYATAEELAARGPLDVTNLLTSICQARVVWKRWSSCALSVFLSLPSSCPVAPRPKCVPRLNGSTPWRSSTNPSTLMAC